MERVFTQDLGRWKRGERRDYPMHVWQRIADSQRRKLELFTKPLGELLDAASVPRQQKAGRV